MASKDTAVGKGDKAEQAYDRLKKSEGWEVVIKSTRSTGPILNPNPKARKFRKFIHGTKIVDLGNAFDRIYVRNDEVEFAQITVRGALADHRRKVEENFPVIFTIPNLRVTIPLWRKVQHGKVERYEFDIVEWVYSDLLHQMVWIERQERLK